MLIGLGIASTTIQAEQRDNAAEAVIGLKAYAAFKAGNYEEARQIWQRLADKGNTTAMINLANLFQQGKGVSENHEHAFKYIVEAARLGDSRAQYELGIEYEKGILVSRDIDKAAKWLHKSALQDDVDGQFAYAVMLATDFGNGLEQAGPEQRQEAGAWFRKAAANGHPDAGAYIKLLSE
ncbi:MAG: sel1 repeat family protein [Gammaproteobacteria bacterium]|nr:sel1 repeat family protein [Gammaproteobacteria bacterium]